MILFIIVPICTNHIQYVSSSILIVSISTMDTILYLGGRIISAWQLDYGYNDSIPLVLNGSTCNDVHNLFPFPIPTFHMLRKRHIFYWKQHTKSWLGKQAPYIAKVKWYESLGRTQPWKLACKKRVPKS